jgi:hypothetical protein
MSQFCILEAHRRPTVRTSLYSLPESRGAWLGAHGRTGSATATPSTLADAPGLFSDLKPQRESRLA